MDTLYRNKRRNDFKNWKSRVRLHLPELAIKFYTAKKGGIYIPYEKEKLLGTVIKEINNPFYSILDERGDYVNSTSELSLIIILEIQVEELFKYINTRL